jgi:hypothetical protein
MLQHIFLDIWEVFFHFLSILNKPKFCGPAQIIKTNQTELPDLVILHVYQCELKCSFFSKVLTLKF